MQSTRSAARHFPECGRRWSYGRLDQPCAELATHRVTDLRGDSVPACATHAAEASQQLDDAPSSSCCQPAVDHASVVSV
jgi:hypothetical protein